MGNTMKILDRDFKKGNVSVQVEDIDDLWYLSQIIEQGDLIRKKTERKIKLKNKSDQTQSSYKKTFYMLLEVDKTEFHEYSDVLRVSGIVREAVEEVTTGSHHTFNIEKGSRVDIIKEKWMKYQIMRLSEARSRWKDVLLCVLDREKAFCALLKKQGYKILFELHNSQSKKSSSAKPVDYYKELASKIDDYNTRYELDSVIVASPAFWKEELMDYMGEEVRKKIITSSCSTAEKSAINEVLNRHEIKKALENQRVAKESRLVEELLKEISDSGKAAYGIDETEKMVVMGAVSILLVTTDLIHKRRQEDSFKRIQQIMNRAESTDAQVSIINSKNQPGRKLDSLGGIAAILRYKIH